MNTIPIEISAGAYWKPLPEVISYEATIPLTYETPWSNEDTYSVSGEVKCPSSNDICRIFRKLDALEEAYQTELQTMKQSWITEKIATTSNKKARRALDFIGEGLSWCCGVATQQKLNSLTMDEGAVRQKLEKVSKGLSETLKFTLENSEKFNEYQKQAAATWKETEHTIQYLEKITDDIQNSIIQTEQQDHFVIVSILTHQFQNMRGMIQLSRALKRQSIMNSCKHHQIPQTVLKPEVLSEDLQRLDKELQNSGQGLAIQTQDLSKFYQLPLSECTFTSEKLYVHIKIPIIQRDQYWNLYELITTPFAWYNQTCIIPHQTLYLAVATHQKYFKENVRQISGTGLHQCKPYQDKLCYIPRFSADNLKGPECAKKLYEGATVETLSHHCPMSCHTNATTISDIFEETYIITNPKKKT